MAIPSFIDNPFLRHRPPRPQKQPYLNPEQEDSLLNWLSQKGMGGLAYVGSTLDKPGRAVRGTISGLMGGDWGGGLTNLVPFSDAMGWTDPAQAVSGRDLLEQFGAIDPNTPGLDVGDVAGFATELATDPLTYLTLGGSALTKSGKVAEAIGAMPKAIYKPGIKAALEAGPRAQRITNTLADVVTPANRAAAEAAAEGLSTTVDDLLQSGEKLGGLFGFGNPFGSGPAKMVFGSGDNPLALKAAQGMDWLGDAVRYSAPGRALGALFDVGARDTYLKPTQVHAANDLTPRLREALEGASGKVLEVNRMLEQTGIDRAAMRPLLDKVVENIPLTPAEMAIFQSPEQQQLFMDAVNLMRTTKDEVYNTAKSLGLPYGFFDEAQEGIGHFPRSLYDVQQGANRDWRKLFQMKSDTMNARATDLRDLPRHVVEQMASDPNIVGAADPVAAADYIRKTYLGSVTDPAKLASQGDALAKRFAALSPETIGKPFYNDPMTDYARYLRQQMEVIETSKSLMDFLSKNADQVPAGQGSVSLSEALAKTGHSGGLPNTPAAKQAMEELASRMPGYAQSGLDAKTFLDQFSVPAELAADASRLMAGFTTPEAMRPLMSVFDGFTNLWKTSLTSPWPSFHARNMMTGIWQNFVGGSFSPKAYVDAYDLISGGTKANLLDLPMFRKMGITDEKEAQSIFRDMLYQYGVTSNTISNELKHLRKPETFLGNIPGKAGGETSLGTVGNAFKSGLTNEGLGNNTLWEKLNAIPRSAVKGGHEVANLAESVNRASGFLALLRKGYSPSEAAAKIRAMHVDFAHLTKFEKSFMRRLMPWYSWQKNIIPVVLKELIERPAGWTGQQARYTANARDNEAFLPDYLQGGMSIPIGEPVDGKQKYLRELDLPAEGVFEPLATGPNAFTDTGLGLLGMTHPLFKAPLEMATGKQFYTNRDLRDLYGPTGNWFYDHILMNAPLTPRLLTAGRTLADDRKDMGTKAMNLLTGIKFSDVDLDKQKSIKARELIEESLRGEEGVKLFENMYVDPASLATLPDDQRALYELYRVLQKRSQQQARQAKSKSANR